MTLQDYQKRVDTWIGTIGVRYFNEMTNSLLLVEEVGEFSRLVAREFGEQSFKRDHAPADLKAAIADEMSDILFVLTCLANQMDINLTDAVIANLDKKTKRDIDRHQQNTKLQND